MQDGPASISIKTGPRSPPGIGRKIVRNCFEGGFDIWREFLVELDDQKRYTGFAALEMPLPDVNAGDATRSERWPHFGGASLFVRPVRLIRPRRQAGQRLPLLFPASRSQT